MQGLSAEMLRQLVIGDIVIEREAQDAKWGEQNHDDVAADHVSKTAGLVHLTAMQRAAIYYLVPTAQQAKDACDSEHRRGVGSWFSILLEEVTEALESAVEGDMVNLDKELNQVAAVAVAWREALHRRDDNVVKIESTREDLL